MILVTGASGQLASEIVALSRKRSLQIKTASRTGDADQFMNFDEPASLNFANIDLLFLTSAGYAEDDVVIRRHAAVIDAAVKYGVRHIIYTSLSKASDHLGFALAHRWTEAYLRASGMRWTILRNGLYAELIGSLLSPVAGNITAPFGGGKISAIARSDLAAAAVQVLSEPDTHINKCYELSGHKSFTVQDIADATAATYLPSTFEEERSRLLELPLLPFQVPMLLSIYASATAGFLETKTTDLFSLVSAPKDALKIASAVANTMRT